MNAAGIIQARMGSERLPGKILAPLVGSKSLLEVLVTRLHSSSMPWWLATTREPSDDVTATVGKALGLQVYRGNDWDVLSRFAKIIKLSGAEFFVRVTADNPFTHGSIVDQVLESLLSADNQMACVRVVGTERRFPLGFVPEAVRSSDLLELEESIRNPQSVHRTHVTSAFPDTRIHFFDKPGLPARPEWRWTVDTALDLDMARASFRLFQDSWHNIDYADMVEVLDRRPDIATMNARVEQKSIADG